ncbi:MAG: helix-turn-helix transcriptional regulator [Bradymonadaceae bacterium]|nr:helix-turn-helix transcriptional regulator [Lujinxingiaceae bacterium]
MNEQIAVADVATLGEALRQARKAQGLTQQDFADIVGVGVRFLSELERGKPTAEIGLVLQVLRDSGFELVLQRRTHRGPTLSGQGDVREDVEP